MSSRPGLLFGILALFLIIVGLVFLTLTSSPFAYQKFGSAYHFLKHQLLYGFLPGVFLFLFFWKLNYLKWKRVYKIIFGLCVISLFLVFIPGLGASFGKARSWLSFGSISFQPSEFVKLGLIIFLSGLLVKMQRQRDDSNKSFKTKSIEMFDGIESRKGFLFYFLFVFLVCALIVAQPDVGTAFLIGLIATTMFFLGGGKLLHLGILGLAGGIGSFILIKIAPYRMARLTAFLNPSFDPQGVGYHINQALIAIGSGGFFGLGLGHSRQKFQYLPEVIGDSIFAIMGEELGFFLCLAFIIAFFVFLWQGFKIAEKSQSRFGYYIVCGIIIWFGWQFVLNISSMIGIFPLTGLTLPFISYGGSSLAASMAAVGLVMNVAKHNS
jgi:cell division protein FtsW